MAVEITGKYLGGLTCEARHGPSGAVLRTTAPVDNGGKGDLFSPTDLLATATGVCMLTIMGIWANKHGLNIDGTTFRLEKHMSADAPRRVTHLPIVMQVKGAIPADKRASLEASALACPVKKSLHPDVKVDVRFEYE